MVKKTTQSARRLFSKKVIIITAAVLLVAIISGISYALLRPAPETAVKEPTPQPTTKPATDDKTPPDTTTPTTTPVTPAPVTFAISSVYFSQSPKAPAGAGFGECSIGQVITYSATADLTATRSGTATYHWELADNFSGNVVKSADQTVTFSARGTKKVSQDFSYTVVDLGNGNNYNTRQYLNVFVTSPNATYANIGHPEYSAYKNSIESYFIWGTYIGLC
jgi:hypothetical protein